MTKNADPDKYSYSGDGIGFYARGIFPVSNNSGFCKNIILFGVDNSSSVHVDNTKK